MAAMADEKKNPLGPVGNYVRQNLERLRAARGLTYRDLSELLEKRGRPIPTLGLSRIEKGSRRVDADDLIALAVVLGVHPNALLLPFTAEGDAEITGAGLVPAATAWKWAEGRRPLHVPDGDDGTAEVDFQAHARPAGIRTYNIATRAGMATLRAVEPEQAERVERLDWTGDDGRDLIHRGEDGR